MQRTPRLFSKFAFAYLSSRLDSTPAEAVPVAAAHHNLKPSPVVIIRNNGECHLGEAYFMMPSGYRVSNLVIGNGFLMETVRTYGTFHLNDPISPIQGAKLARALRVAPNS